MSKIEHVDIDYFDKRAVLGRSRPLYCSAENGKDYYIKFTGLRDGLTNEQLFCESAGNELALLLGLPACRPAIATIPRGLLDLHVNISDDASIVLSDDGEFILAFGSESAGGQFKSWDVQSRLDKSQLQVALEILIFDHLTENDDRIIGNPNNALWNGEQINIIDFENCFSRILENKADPTTPHHLVWDKSKLIVCWYIYQGDRQHIFYSKLKGKINQDMIKLCLSKWKNLNLDDFSVYLNDIGQIWGSSIVDETVSYIGQVMEHIDELAKMFEEYLK